MSAASPSSLLPVPEVRQSGNPISRRQVEKVASRSVGVFGLVFAAQSVPWLMGQSQQAYPVWLWIVVPVLYGTLLVVFVLSFVHVRVRQAHAAFSIVYLAVLISWPFAEMPGVEIFTGIPWLNYLITVAAATSAIAFSTVLATVYLLVVELIYFVVRSTPLGGGASWTLATLETVYGVILGGALIIILAMLRQAATAVDVAQATALDRYGLAVRQHATEVERVQVDAIVHDSVLSTLLSASRARSQKAMALAATMARNAIGQLNDAALAAPDGLPMVPTRLLSERIIDSARTLLSPFEMRGDGFGASLIPVQASEAIYAAAVQSMVNSVQHAGAAGEPSTGLRRWVTVRELPPGGIEVVVGDAGVGFSLRDVPALRIGVRVSIIERVANAGGRAEILTKPGAGTVVTIRWPNGAPDAHPHETSEPTS